ncbi:LCP family protein [Corynebacterium aurimucosum]|uniref:LCP family protein n=1 Tax=Corynebacterium aurimucosum TaxID=169292 RepID=UPI001879269C|nr:LCP family protein [Corynebacterium aurimucosum]MBE7339363.1 LCP family protein [Corynebacterium aurimucosum]
MTYQGHDPERDSRRAGDPHGTPRRAGSADSANPSRPHNSAGPRASHAAGHDAGEFVLGADGQPLRDRYGRPVRRRPSAQRSASSHSSARAQRPSPRREETRFDVDAYMAQRSPARPVPRQSAPTREPAGAYRRSPDAPPRSYAPQAPSHGRTAGRPHRRRKKVNPTKQVFGCLGWIVVIALVFMVAFTLWTDSRLTRIDALPTEQVAQTSGTNWLLVGSDSRQGLTEEQQAELGTGGDVGVGRTDTIMLLHIPASGKAQLVSIPRDSYVDVPGFGMDKVNAAFTYGGPQLLTQTVEQATGLHIDHYAEIGMGGLANVVDSVGGVDICVKEPINDPLAGIDLQAGCQKLRGPDALGYVRTRATAMGDLDRVERQREFFAALLDKATSFSTIGNPFKAISLVNHTADSFIVNEKDHVWHLARVALSMASGVETKTVPIGGFEDTVVGNVVLWDDAEAQALWGSMR